MINLSGLGLTQLSNVFLLRTYYPSLTNARLGKNSICGPYNEQWRSPITMNFDLHNSTLWCPPAYATGCYQFPTPSLVYVYPSTTSVTIQLPSAAYTCDTFLSLSAFCKYDVLGNIYYSSLSYNSQTKKIDCLKSNFPNSNKKLLSLYWNSPFPFDISNQIQIIQLYQGALTQPSNQASFANIGKTFTFYISNQIDPAFWPFIFCSSDLGQNFSTSTSDGIKFTSFITLPKFSYITLVFINGSKYEIVSTNSIAISFFSSQSFTNTPYSSLTTSTVSFSSFATIPLPIFYLNVVYLIDGVVFIPYSATQSNFYIILNSPTVQQNRNLNISLNWRNPEDSSLLLLSNSSYIFSFVKPINIIKIDPIANYIGNGYVSFYTDHSPYDYQNNIYFQCKYSLIGISYSVNATVAGNIFSCYININYETSVSISIWSVSKSESIQVSTTSVQYWVLDSITISTWYPFVGSYNSPMSSFSVKTNRVLSKYDNILCFLKLNNGNSYYYQSVHSISTYSVLDCSFIYSNITIDNVETVTISLVYNATVVNSKLFTLSNNFNISMFRSKSFY
jgi:hypothetical protein